MAELLHCLTGHLTQLRQQLHDTKLLMKDLLPAAYRLQGMPLPGPVDLLLVEHLANELLDPRTAEVPAPAAAVAPLVRKATAKVATAKGTAKATTQHRYSEAEKLRILDTSNMASELAAEFGMTEGSLYSLRSRLKKTMAPAVALAAPAESVGGLEEWAAAPDPPAAPEAKPARKTFGLAARAEELTEQWQERELSHATPNELGEILNLLRHVPREKRGVLMGLVLDRAEAEHSHRIVAAGKGKGVARG